MKYITYIIFCLLVISANSQTEYEQEIRSKLENLSSQQPGLNETVSISVSDAPIGDFLSAIAAEHKLNISVDQKLNILISNNFTNAKVTDVMMFLVLQYELQIDFIGEILFFKKRPKIVKTEVPKPKSLDINYRTDNTFLSVNLKNDTLYAVAKEITEKSGRNVVASPNVRQKLVSAYITNRPFE
ncbi:MAG: type II and III secretion system protein, partial [Crocinitomicaceae bacterium]|nr:type II and III secretion system protein [Crocinitomicaceae bacterium]